jgi:hypothetical protein
MAEQLSDSSHGAQTGNGRSVSKTSIDSSLDTVLLLQKPAKR